MRAGGVGETNFAFTGQRNLDAVGLMDYNARWYEQTVGAFTQPGSIVASFGLPQSLNRYAYAANNPLRFIDPSGHIICHPDRPCIPAPYPDPDPPPICYYCQPAPKPGPGDGGGNNGGGNNGGGNTGRDDNEDDGPPTGSGGVDDDLSGEGWATSYDCNEHYECFPIVDPFSICIGDPDLYLLPCYSGIFFNPNDVDWRSVRIGVLGIAGDVGFKSGHPLGVGLFLYSEYVELVDLGGQFDSLESGEYLDPGEWVRFATDTAVEVTDRAGRLDPTRGFLYSIVGVLLDLGPGFQMRQVP